ncbi:hypothetical protein FB639_006497, partial [Coemansia asiatica]
MPVKREDTATIVEGDKQNSNSNNEDDSSTLGGWLGRLLCGLRKFRESSATTNGSNNCNGNSNSSSSRKIRSKPSVAIVESGAVIIGPVKDGNNVAIPAEIMFSTQRASLYSAMMTLLVHNPFYFSRIVSRVKYHECDALLSIILDSVFGFPAYEPSLTALFT